MSPSAKEPGTFQASAELRRVLASAILAFVLIGVSAILDGPVSLLSWMLLGAGFLSLFYVIVASLSLLKHFRSQNHR